MADSGGEEGGEDSSSAAISTSTSTSASTAITPTFQAGLSSSSSNSSVTTAKLPTPIAAAAAASSAIPTEGDVRKHYKKDPSQRIFVGRSLRLEKIKFYGFDMDYTLASFFLLFFSYSIMFTQDGIFVGILMTLLNWPIFVPLLASLAYLFFKNRPANPFTVQQFFKTFNVGGHRGSPIKQPENTMISMKQAKKEGADLIEFDVSLTKDGIAVILHDDTLDRTTNFTGPVRQYLFKDLSMINCAAKFAPTQQIANNDASNIAATQAAMPTLEEIVQWSKENNMKMLFDVKDSDAILVEQLNTLFDKYDLYETGIVCSFFPIVVYRIKKLCPRILTGITWRRWCYSFADLASTVPRFKGIAHYLAIIIDILNVWSIKSWLPSFLGVDMILTERADISETFVQQQKSAGRHVCAWTVNDLTEMNWMRQTLSIPVLTDKPFLIDQMKGHGKKI